MLSTRVVVALQRICSIKIIFYKSESLGRDMHSRRLKGTRVCVTWVCRANFAAFFFCRGYLKQ